MLQKILNLFHDNRPRLVPNADHVLIITAFVKDGMVAVTYKNQIKRGQFDDKTLRDMVYGINFQENASSFFSAVARLMEQIIIKK